MVAPPFNFELDSSGSNPRVWIVSKNETLPTGLADEWSRVAPTVAAWPSGGLWATYGTAGWAGSPKPLCLLGVLGHLTLSTPLL